LPFGHFLFFSALHILPFFCHPEAFLEKAATDLR
jgi:hypothetical protein